MNLLLPDTSSQANGPRDVDIDVEGGAVRAEGELDTEASEEELDTLLKLTERYCVVFQTLSTPPRPSASIATNS